MKPNLAVTYHLFALLTVMPCFAQSSPVTEYPLKWPGEASGSTHELTYNHDGGKVVWVTGQNHDHLARVAADGKTDYFPMPPGSRPHGILFDGDGVLWVSLEFAGLVVSIDQETGSIMEQIDVRIRAEGAKAPINPCPHGLGLGPDGKTLWFTGKKTNTVGKINPDKSIEHFELPTVGAVLIYLSAGPDGNMWGTELVGNKIMRVTPEGRIDEFEIPTKGSRPIAIVRGPDGRSMWFSEEAGNKVGRIDMEGAISEYPIPLTQRNVILAGMAFDDMGNLWTHSYVNGKEPSPAGADHLIRIDKSIVSAQAGDLTNIPVTFYQVPTRNTVMHRIMQGPDGAIWFTELGADKLGKLQLSR